ncbi:hypothetical protein FKM82_023299 [Ascaphus truei]
MVLCDILLLLSEGGSLRAPPPPMNIAKLVWSIQSPVVWGCPSPPGVLSCVIYLPKDLVIVIEAFHKIAVFRGPPEELLANIALCLKCC